MIVHELPKDWLQPWSDGFTMIVGGNAAQVLLLIPCGGCNRGAHFSAPGCDTCAGSLIVGYVTMRCPLGELLDAIRAHDALPPTRPPSPAQRIFTGALSDQAALIVMGGACPTCGGALANDIDCGLSTTAARCSGTCGKVYQILVDRGPTLVVTEETRGGRRG